VFATTLLLTLTNPFTMTGFIAIFGGAAQTLGRGSDYSAVIIIVMSVMAGSMLWWIFLSALVVRLRERFDSRRLAQINSVTAIAVTLFGVFLLARVIISLVQ
jgi:threonine/homoserine/homoserine lactone efflux protein